MAKGDHIYVFRAGYTHHGIDCGDGTVIHYSGDLSSKRGASVRRISMREFAGTRKVHTKYHCSSNDSETTVRRAQSRLGESRYNLLKNNCEHFATWCKNGKAESTQVKRIADTVIKVSYLTAVRYLGKTAFIGPAGPALIDGGFAGYTVYKAWKYLRNS
ncbi:lecithin retinol acyltransferase family protein [Desulfonatronovibrio magnus]|uniref:lecithin retinol acyltransferase family protein n=1 Tax=Desulfonatronovibrio magnus TaxID=698827 RepID=UPI000695F248|nr:lecithin retinol acyltransferase family protein [Desulfonatronovibrio magnus]